MKREPDPVYQRCRDEQDAIEASWQTYSEAFSKANPTQPTHDTKTTLFYVRRAVHFLLTQPAAPPHDWARVAAEKIRQSCPYTGAGTCLDAGRITAIVLEALQGVAAPIQMSGEVCGINYADPALPDSAPPPVPEEQEVNSSKSRIEPGHSAVEAEEDNSLRAAPTDMM